MQVPETNTLTNHIGTRKPSEKALIAWKNWVEDGGSMGEAMVKAGYSKVTAKNPSKVFGTTLGKEVVSKKLENVFTKEFLMNKLGELMGAEEIVEFKFDDCVTDEEILEILSKCGKKVIHVSKARNGVKIAYYMETVWRVSARAVDMALRVTGMYKQ